MFSPLERINKCLSIPMISGLYYKHMMIVNDASSVVNKIEALLTDNARVIIYDHHVFIAHSTEL
jgi:hypothetical protein